MSFGCYRSVLCVRSDQMGFFRWSRRSRDLSSRLRFTSELSAGRAEQGRAVVQGVAAARSNVVAFAIPLTSVTVGKKNKGRWREQRISGNIQGVQSGVF